MDGQEPHVRVGQIVGTHGVKGGLKVFPLTDIESRFEPGEVVFLRGLAHKIERTTWHKGQVRIQLEGVKGMTYAETLKWEYLTVPESKKPTLEKGVFLARDLVGMKVVTTSGDEVGLVEEVVESPAHDLLRIGNALIPVVKEFVKDIDMEQRTIKVEVIPGLLEDEPE